MKSHHSGVTGMPLPNATLYQVLMVDPGADDDIITTVYRRLLQRVQGPPDRIKAIEQAYKVLRDRHTRRLYDLRIALELVGRGGPMPAPMGAPVPSIPIDPAPSSWQGAATPQPW